MQRDDSEALLTETTADLLNNVVSPETPMIDVFNVNEFAHVNDDDDSSAAWHDEQYLAYERRRIASLQKLEQDHVHV